MTTDLAATPTVHVAVAALAGALGGWLRAVMRDETLALGRPAWMGTFAINMVACLLIGIFGTSSSGSWTHTLVVMGILGGYSTFSSMIVDAVVQWRAHNHRTAFFIVGGTTVVGTLLATLGKWTALGASATVGTFRHPRPHWVHHGGRWRHHIGGMPLILAAGAVGNLIRVAVLDSTASSPHAWLATATVNIAGSGLCAAAYRLINAIDSDGRSRHDEPRRVAWERAIMTGFCGGLTTMSTLALEIATILPASPPLAILVWSVNVGGGLLAAIAGWSVVAALEKKLPSTAQR